MYICKLDSVVCFLYTFRHIVIFMFNVEAISAKMTTGKGALLAVTFQLNSSEISCH